MRSEDQQETNRSFYNRISQVYDFIADAGEHTARERGEQALAVQPGERVLEVGFGTGNSVLNLAKNVGDEGQVCGVDVSSGMLSVAEKKIAAEGLLERVRLQVSDARELPYDDESFDAAFTSFTLELFALEDIPKVLSEIRRVLRGDGRLGVVSMATVKEGDHPSMLENTYVWMHRHFPHIVDCQPINTIQFMKDAGFQIQENIDMSIWTMPVAVVVGQKVS